MNEFDSLNFLQEITQFEEKFKLEKYSYYKLFDTFDLLPNDEVRKFSNIKKVIAFCKVSLTRIDLQKQHLNDFMKELNNTSNTMQNTSFYCLINSKLYRLHNELTNIAVKMNDLTNEFENQNSSKAKLELNCY